MLNTLKISFFQIRTKIHFSITDGKPITNFEVVSRYFRLNNGLWIHAKPKRRSRVWKKTEFSNISRHEHVFTSEEKCIMLDKLVDKEWKERRHFINDEYSEYHKWDNLPKYKYLKKVDKFYP
ncbi:putative 39S ribosomal protein L35, mitochondrial [Intoshia linei]|uniref:Putative 39S ribosomal protein L35, mitochondrial n=1 Tax=Intoshia linei TaxID=1819745 RepID=A0A177B8B2_9BILA|nr:putative 39S ribosomal protein L35, mitochondrial [Intoshia linei]